MLHKLYRLLEAPYVPNLPGLEDGEVFQLLLLCNSLIINLASQKNHFIMVMGPVDQAFGQYTARCACLSVPLCLEPEDNSWLVMTWWLEAGITWKLIYSYVWCLILAVIWKLSWSCWAFKIGLSMWLDFPTAWQPQGTHTFYMITPSSKQECPHLHMLHIFWPSLRYHTAWL